MKRHIYIVLLATPAVLLIIWAIGYIFPTHFYSPGRREELEGQGLAGNEIDDRLSTLILTHDAVKKWRTIHVPMVFILIMTTAYHILSALYYDGFWR